MNFEWIFSKAFWTSSLVCCTVFAPIFQSAQESPTQQESKLLSVRGSIIIDNQVLATVRGQVITVYDLVKKLDMVFYRQFPEYRSSPEARVHFYRNHWRTVLKDLIDRQLVLAHAEDKKFEVSRGDIREELEEFFGPDVMMNLYNAGLSRYDVEEMIKADILMRRILGYFVKAPVIASLTPETLRKAYEERAQRTEKEQQGSEEWVWQAITISSEKGDIPEEKVATISEQIRTAHANHSFAEPLVLEEEFTITPSRLFTSHVAELSSQIRAVLEKLPLSTISAPIQVASRSADKGTTWKMYRLIERKVQVVQQLPFREMEMALKEEIAAPLVLKKTEEFFDSLKQEYGVTMTLSDKELALLDPFQVKRDL